MKFSLVPKAWLLVYIVTGDMMGPGVLHQVLGLCLGA